jgi:RNA polymerase sigma-70 factor (ECF subfamily)
MHPKTAEQAEQDVERLFHASYRVLRAYAGRFTLCEAAGDDIVQDAFLRLFRLALSARWPDNPRGWLVRVVRNLAIDYLRANRFEGSAPASGLIDDTGGPADAERVFLENERRRHMRLALAKLPPQERACVLLRAQGQRYREISERLGISINSVGPTLAHAFSKLQRCHEDDEIHARTATSQRRGPA